MDTLPSSSLHRWFWLFILLNALFIGWSLYYLYPLTFGEMVQLEVARKLPVAERIVQQFTAEGKTDLALQSVYLDYIFIPLYTGGLGISCLFFSRLTKHEILIRTAKFFFYLLIAAGICDVIENMALTRILHGALTSFNVLLAYDMAAAKFSVIILSLLLLVICGIFWLSSKVDRYRVVKL